MFTGIVEEVGRLEELDSLTLRIGARTVLEGLGPGDSVAVNGVCLTATSIDSRSFTVDVVPETRRRSNFGDLEVGAPLNLERALAAGDRMGGHIVQGHVEATAKITSIIQDDEAGLWTFSAGPGLMRYIVPKGFIAIDGVSLTVIDIDTETETFSITLIPHTAQATNFGTKRAGEIVNVEIDVLGRYVERLLESHLLRIQSKIEKGSVSREN